MIYTVEDLRIQVKEVAIRFDIEKIWIFGSYYDSTATETSDVDLLVQYGIGCRGMDRIRFMNSLEEQLQKEVDVTNINFAPDFVSRLDLNSNGRVIYEEEQEDTEEE